MSPSDKNPEHTLGIFLYKLPILIIMKCISFIKSWLFEFDLADDRWNTQRGFLRVLNAARTHEFKIERFSAADLIRVLAWLNHLVCNQL